MTIRQVNALGWVWLGIAVVAAVLGSGAAIIVGSALGCQFCWLTAEILEAIAKIGTGVKS